MKLLLFNVVIFSSILSQCYAQPNGPYGNNGPTRIELEGKLQAWQGGMMQIVNVAGQPIMFTLPQSPAGIRFTVPVEKAALKPGMVVRFQAPAANGAFLDPIRTLTIFAPDSSKISARSSAIERSMSVPGIYRLSELYRAAPGESASPDVRIVGAILQIEANMLSLNCGNTPMKVELADSPKIEFNSSSLDLARPGDAVKGSATFNPNANQLVASTISVTGAKALTAEAPVVSSPATTKLRVKETPKSKVKASKKAAIPDSPESPLAPQKIEN
ncbi:MAG: hypothetical protein SGI77_17820 [Pirellulaceae bacterium]|nr:hypothetical protein [Pirellulaceae bacterium]